MSAIAESLETLRDDDQNFPHHVLEGQETALCLFAAGFYGRQDAFWVADAGLTGTCVDEDATLLGVMSRMYPEDWQFLRFDAYGFPATTDRQWDVVTLDPWTNQFQRCADHLGHWCRLAKHAVILGTGWNTNVVAPPGWKVSEVRKRSDYDRGVFWTVIQPT